MNKCPFCRAEIEDDARFCLYCMRTLNEKKVIAYKQKKGLWWILIAVVVLCAVIVGAYLLLKGNTKTLPEQVNNLTPSPGITQTMPNETLPQEPAEDNENVMEPTFPIPTETENVPLIVTDPHDETTNEDPVEDNTAGKATEPPTQPPTEEIEEEITQQSRIVYDYRTATTADDFSAYYQNSGNDIVIIGVLQPATDGVYDIPAYIDGKKVIAIGANAFYGSSAKVVYIPETVRNIWNYAFYGCQLTDVYFRGESIYTESMAFEGNFNLHCSATCDDRSYRYYKDCAGAYGAVWIEWNG